MIMRYLFFTAILISLTFSFPAQISQRLRIYNETSIYLLNDFVEFNKKQKMYDIEEIKFRTTRCFGTCPQFNIEIDKSKNAIFDAIYYNRKNKNDNEIKGKFKAVIKDIDFNNILNLLNIIDFPKLNDNYSIGRRDYPTCFLTITYDNGKIKKITDYGLSGTSELKELYSLMFELRFNQKWEKR